MAIEKWDGRFLKQAKEWSLYSKDPSTKTGAVITVGNRVRGSGYNGFAPEVQDTNERLNERAIKYEMVIHCEVNAVIAANGRVQGGTLYTWPFMSCSRCAAQMIAWGIKRHVAPELAEDKAFRVKRSESWHHSMQLARQQFEEAGVELLFCTEEELNEIGLTLKGT